MPQLEKEKAGGRPASSDNVQQREKNPQSSANPPGNPYPSPRALKPCPFCEREARMAQTADGAFWYYVECSHCYSRQLASQTEKEAIRRWNMRGKDWTWRPASGA